MSNRKNRKEVRGRIIRGRKIGRKRTLEGERRNRKNR
jgi:hypothetical protein